MNQKLSFLFSALIAISSSSSTTFAHELPDVGGILVYHFDPKGKVSGLDAVINLDPITDVNEAVRCEYAVTLMSIDTVVYDGVSEVVAGFRTADETLFRVESGALYKNVSNAERYLVKDLFKRGQQVLASYSVCGSGGAIYLREIYKASALKGQRHAPRSK